MSMVREGFALLRCSSFDMIVMRPDVFPFAQLALTRKARIPYALKTAGDGQFPVFARKRWWWRMLRPVNGALFKRLVNGAVAADVVSRMQQSDLQATAGEQDKIAWIDNGANIRRFQPIEREVARHAAGVERRLDPVIGYCGNFPSSRGAAQLVEALPRLVESLPGIGVLVVGWDANLRSLKARAATLGVSDRCLFANKVDYESVPTYINAMDLCISLRQPDTQNDSELKVRQYLACGKPVVVSPGSNDFVDEEGIGRVVEPNDIDALADAASEILRLGKSEYEQMARRSRRFAEDALSYRSKVKERLHLWEVKINGRTSVRS